MSVGVLKIDRGRRYGKINERLGAGVLETMNLTVGETRNLATTEASRFLIRQQQRPRATQGDPYLLCGIVGMTRLDGAGLNGYTGDRDSRGARIVRREDLLGGHAGVGQLPEISARKELHSGSLLRVRCSAKFLRRLGRTPERGVEFTGTAWSKLAAATIVALPFPKSVG